jgi:hypothetical protein
MRNATTLHVAQRKKPTRKKYRLYKAFLYFKFARDLRARRVSQHRYSKIDAHKRRASAR